MSDSKPPSIFRLVGGLLLGLTVLVFSSSMFTAISGRDFWSVFVAVSGSTLFTGTILLVWLTRWAMRDDGRISQFGIGTLLMLTGLAAVYLGFVRWLADHSHTQYTMGYTEKFITVCVVSGILIAISLIPLLRMAESLVWLATVVVRWKPVRGVLFGWPKRKDP